MSDDLLKTRAVPAVAESSIRRSGMTVVLVVGLAAAGLAGYLLIGPEAAPPTAPPVEVVGADLLGDSSANDELAIPEEVARYLQQAEHLGGFVLGDLTFPKFSEALRSGDSEALAAFFAGDFTGAVFREDSGREASAALARVHTWREPDDQLETLDRQAFVARLLAWRAELDEATSVRLKVMLMRPVTRGELSGPWQGSFKLRLAGRDAEKRLVERIVKFRCRLTGLTEDTPEQTGWLASCEAYEARASRSPRFLLERLSDERTGIDTAALRDNWRQIDKKNLPFLTGGIYLSDYDQDGRVDVLITDLTRLYLYRGVGGGRFVDVTIRSGLPPLAPPNRPPPVGVVFADFDGDSYPDLLIGPTLYRNVAGTRFDEMKPGRDTSLELPADASQYAVADYDGDGRIDLYVVGIKAGPSNHQPWIGDAQGNQNLLFRNLGGWQFEDVTAASGTQGRGGPTFAAAWFDANRDGRPDLMTSCETGRNDYFINNGDGTFTSKLLPDIYGGFSMGLVAGDIDNDGFPDVYVANMYSKAGERVVDNLSPDVYPKEIDAQMRDFVSGNELYRNTGGGVFERIGRAVGVNDVGWAYGPGFVDLNNDGFLDLYAPVGFQSITRDRPDG